MTCNDIRTLLEDDQRDATQDPAVAAHLHTCAECAAYAAIMPAESEALEAMIAGTSDEESWQRVRAQVALRLPPIRESHKRLSRRKLQPTQPATPTPWLMGAAALVGVSLLGAFAILQYTSRQAPPAPIAETPVKQPAPGTQQPGTEITQPTPQPNRNAQAELPAPKTPEAQPRRAPAIPIAALNTKLSQLQVKMRAQNILDDVEQLSLALAESHELEAKSTTDDSELHFERLLMLENCDSEDAYAELRGSKDEAAQLREIQDALNSDAPIEFKQALTRAITTFDEAASLGTLLPEAAPAKAASSDKASTLISDAEVHLRNSEYSDALTKYRAFLDAFPKDRRVPQARYTVAFILEKKLGDADGARTVYQSLADANAHSQLANHALYHVGETYERSGDPSKALAAYEKLKTQDAQAAAALKDKVAFLDKKIKGVQAPRPGWAAQIVQTAPIMKPRPAVKKATRTISR